MIRYNGVTVYAGKRGWTLSNSFRASVLRVNILRVKSPSLHRDKKKLIPNVNRYIFTVIYLRMKKVRDKIIEGEKETWNPI